LRLLSYNIRYGGTGREEALAATIKSLEPDIVILQEATHPRVVERLAAATGLPHWAARSEHSVGFLSRLPVAHHAWHRPRGAWRSFLELEVEGSSVRLFGVHLTAIHSNWTERQRVREMRSLLASIAGRAGDPILVGDFNTLAPGERLDVTHLPWRLRFLAWIGGRTIRWQTVQIMLDAGFLVAFLIVNPDVP
jgi:exodeoxyribonuclease-3